MERGLFWLPLLGVFIGLAWAGWSEYRKLEAYKLWAQEWERAKYDIYAVIGQRDSTLVWGRPTRQGPVVAESLNLATIATVTVEDGTVSHGDRGNPDPPLDSPPQLPRGCRICLRLTDTSGIHHDIPFTDGDLATQWGNRLRTLIEDIPTQTLPPA